MMQWVGFTVLRKRMTALKFMMRDKNVPLWKKGLVVLGALYLVSPLDLIPDVVFPVAFLDDLILWIWIFWFLRDELDRYWIGEKEVDLSKSFYGKDIIEGVECEGAEEEKGEKEPPEEG